MCCVCSEYKAPWFSHKKNVSCDENERKSTFFLDEQLNFWIIFFLFCFSLCAAHAFLSSQNTSFLTSFWFFSLHCFFDRFYFLLCVVDVCACMSAHSKTSFKTCHVSFFAIHFLSVSKWKYRFALFSRRILFFFSSRSLLLYYTYTLSKSTYTIAETPTLSSFFCLVVVVISIISLVCV